jgi:capsid protein
VIKIGPFTFGYNAIEDKGRRQSPKPRVLHESDVLGKTKRRKLQATAQDQARNLSLVAWMVRKHLDYVSKFHISFRTDKPELDKLVNRIFRWHGRPENLDYMQRFGRDEFFRMFELEKILCGDAAILKLPDLKLQALESDQITKGDGAPEGVNDDGLVVDDMGRPTHFAICKRNSSAGVGSQYVHDHLEPRGNVMFDAYWTRFISQYRGVSPLSTAINTIQDLHEGFEFNQIKAKMHALFGIAITRKDDAGDGTLGGAAGATAETSSATANATGTTFDIDPRSINLLDMNPGEDVKAIESGTPSSEFVEGSYLFIQIAMLALDIPVTFFDSRRSSFSARIADLNEYEVSNDAKRTKNRYVRQAYSDWVLEQIWNDAASPWGLKTVAVASGFARLRDVQEQVEWVASGSPWLDKANQLAGDQLGIGLGLDNAIDAARRRGGDVFHNIDRQAQVIEYAKLKGVPLVTGRVADRTVDDAIRETVRDEAKKTKNGEDEGEGDE